VLNPEIEDRDKVEVATGRFFCIGLHETIDVPVNSEKELGLRVENATRIIPKMSFVMAFLI
jgi:hypothetical protein